MWARKDNTRHANVMAAFENQDDADEAVLQLRLSGFRDEQIGYFAPRLRNGRVLDLMDRDYWLVGGILGGVIGAAIGIALSPALAWLMAAPTGPHDPFGLAITCGVFGALFASFLGGWIGMNISRQGVAPPPLGTVDAPFVIAVAAGDARAQALEAIHHHGGHELTLETTATPAPMPAV
jgi:hypothetical protein